ncbi:MAG TPA: response regulator transcription factor [Bryobacteraceae bacterium]|jgi:DNA-binding NarL/FixJ family response regulator|nr:response regulator transcription factor [Bryobacteraceae bacterium]
MACILIVDDHPLIRQGLAGVLMEEFPQGQVVEASDAPEAMRAVGSQTLDLVLLDLTLPGRNGLDLLKEIKALRPRLPVLILSMHSEEQFATRALRSGAAGYLNKNSAPQVLMQAIQRAMAGGKVISPEVAERLAAELTVDTSRPLHEQLSDREHDIFLRIGSGQSVSEIAENLNLSVKTVSTYRTRILNKMGKQNNSELMQYAIRNHLVD